MRRRILLKIAAQLAVFAGGCIASPTYDNSVLIGDAPPPAVTNPAFVPLGPPEYAAVFEAVIDVLDDYFEIALANRYEGRILTFPRVAPGFEQPWRLGSPDGAERFLCTLQSFAYTCDVIIQPSENGYQIFLTVNRYLEDVPRPIRATAGDAAFRSDNTVDRRYEVIEPGRPHSGWIAKGREPYLEQVLLRKIEDKLKR